MTSNNEIKKLNKIIKSLSWLIKHQFNDMEFDMNMNYHTINKVIVMINNAKIVL